MRTLAFGHTLKEITSQTDWYLAILSSRQTEYVLVILTKYVKVTDT